MSDRFTEQVDAAQEMQIATNDQAIARVQSKLEPEWHPDFDGAHCVEDDCGDLMPKARLLMGRIRCVSCQEKLELYKRKFRR